MVLADALDGVQLHVDGLSGTQLGEHDVGVRRCGRVLRHHGFLLALRNPFEVRRPYLVVGVEQRWIGRVPRHARSPFALYLQLEDQSVAVGGLAVWNWTRNTSADGLEREMSTYVPCMPGLRVWELDRDDGRGPRRGRRTCCSRHRHPLCRRSGPATDRQWVGPGMRRSTTRETYLCDQYSAKRVRDRRVDADEIKLDGPVRQPFYPQRESLSLWFGDTARRNQCGRGQTSLNLARLHESSSPA